ncbi:Ferrous-iron efflux pump FieF [subsurface metagenome]
MFSTTSGAAKLSLVVVIGLIVLKVVVAVITGSISILAQAADSFLDLFAIVITFFAVGIAAKPADKNHPFGHGKVENIAAIVQAMLIFTAGGLIIYSAVRRIITGTTVELTEAGIGVMLVSIVASIFLSRHLLKVSRAADSIALQASAHNIAADVYSAAAVLAGLLVIRFTGLNILDPIIALLVALFILKVAYDVLRRSFGGLIDARLPEAEENEIMSCITEHSGQLVGFHELRTRKAGSQRYIDLHLVMPKNSSVEEAHRMCDHLEQDLENRLPHTSVTIHIEPCSIECGQCFVFSCSLRKRSP